jgi:hypothetical protein
VRNSNSFTKYGQSICTIQLRDCSSSVRHFRQGRLPKRKSISAAVDTIRPNDQSYCHSHKMRDQSLMSTRRTALLIIGFATIFMYLFFAPEQSTIRTKRFAREAVSAPESKAATSATVCPKTQAVAIPQPVQYNKNLACATAILDTLCFTWATTTFKA